jgi:hypothetical protein
MKREPESCENCQKFEICLRKKKDPDLLWCSKWINKKTGKPSTVNRNARIREIAGILTLIIGLGLWLASIAAYNGTCAVYCMAPPVGCSVFALVIWLYPVAVMIIFINWLRAEVGDP